MWKWLTDLMATWFKGWWPKPKPEPKPEPKPDPVEPVEPTEYSRTGWDDACFHTCPEAVRTWPVVDRLRVTMSGSQFTYTLEHPDLWPIVPGDKPTIGNLWGFLFRDGVWHGGPCDKLRPVGARKERESICVPDGNIRLYVPISGETVGIALSGFCREGRTMSPKHVTEVAWVVWP